MEWPFVREGRNLLWRGRISRGISPRWDGSWRREGGRDVTPIVGVDIAETVTAENRRDTSFTMGSAAVLVGPETNRDCVSR
jgi:hypothetical protein